MNPEHRLPIDIDKFGFVEREIVNGQKLKNKCGRDFLYYALNYYYPDKFNPNVCAPVNITKKGIFGMQNIPMWLEWTGLSFTKMPELLESLDLKLSINGKEILTFFDFVFALAPFRPMSYEESMKQVEQAVDEGKACGIDIGMALGGLVDHVMFIYGYDADSLYVFDTNQVEGLEYVKLTEAEDPRFIMKLPKEVVKKRWGVSGRVWIVKKK